MAQPQPEHVVAAEPVTPARQSIPDPDANLKTYGQTLDDYLAKQATTQLAAPGRVYSESVAQPVTNALGYVIGKGARGLTPNADPELEARAHALAGFIVPQNLMQAGMLAGTGGAGALGYGAGGRVLASAGGGALGGLLDTGDVAGAVQGGVLGGATGMAGETLGYLGSQVKGSRLGGLAGSPKTIIQNSDARTVVSEGLPGITRLRGVFGQDVQPTPDGIFDLVRGVEERLGPARGGIINKGQARLSTMAQQYDNQIQQQIALKRPNKTNIFLDPMTMEPAKGTASPLQQYFDSLKPVDQARFTAANPNFAPSSAAPAGYTGTFVSWSEARQGLTRLREAADSATGVEKADLSQRYAEALRLFKSKLSDIDPSGTALKAFNDQRETYRAGRFMLDALDQGFNAGSVKSSATPFNSDAVVRYLNKNNVEGNQALGLDGMQRLRASLRATVPGRTDVFNPPGPAINVTGHMPVIGGYAREHLIVPDVMGNPLGLGQTARTGITAGMQMGTGPTGQSLLDPFTQNLLRSRGYSE